MEDEMDERRKSIRQRSSLRGRIYFNDGRASVSCLIHDISYEGARIVILDSIDIPNEIKLCIPEKNRIMHANVRWRHDNKIGLAFSEGVPQISGPPRNIHRAPTPRWWAPSASGRHRAPQAVHALWHWPALQNFVGRRLEQRGRTIVHHDLIASL
jgi:hypothetical protein